MKKLCRIDSSPVQVEIATWYWLEQPFGYSAKAWETAIRKKVEKENPEPRDGMDRDPMGQKKVNKTL